MASVIRWGKGRGKQHRYMITVVPGVYNVRGTLGTTPSFTTPSNSAVVVRRREATPDRASEAEPAARAETDWVESVSPFLPKVMREALLGDLLEERATWQARGKSRLSIEVFTASQLLLSAFALVWGTGKDLLIEIVRKRLGF